MTFSQVKNAKNENLPTVDSLWKELMNNGLVGPWSWSDLLDHAVTVICYHILAKDIEPDRYEQYLDELFQLIRRLVIYRLTRRDR